MGRAVGTVPDFGYSGALAANFDVWTPENLQAFLEDPRSTASGTKMSFAGLDDIEDRANVIAYLQSVSELIAPRFPGKDTSRLRSDARAAFFLRHKGL